MKAYAKMQGLSVSALLRRSVLERIEDEYDLTVYEEAMREYQSDKKTYTLSDIQNILEND